MQGKEKSRNRENAGTSPTAEGVLLVFSEINKVQTASKAQVFQLVRLFKNQPNAFSSAFELAYLKIFKIFHEKNNRKMPPKFQQLVASLFTELLSGESEGPAVIFFNYFLNFLADGIFSSLTGIRITTARMMFHLVKQALQMVSAESRANVLKSVFFLLRLKVSTYKQMGIKLASLVLGWQHELRDKIEFELFKILATEDNEQIRKMAITNLALNPNNLDKVLIRLRDKSSDIRSIVLRKITGEKFKLQEMSACNRMHLLYDGYGNKETSIQQDSLRYFAKYFQGERHKEDFGEFVELFRPGVLLVYPHLYALFDSLVIGIIEELPIQQLCNFTKKLTNELKHLSKNSGSKSVYPELIWLKNMGKVDRSDAKTIFQQCVPSGLELSKVLLELLKGRDVWSIYECLQLFSLQRSADELGRNKMFDSLKKIVMELQYFEVASDWSGLDRDDICPPLTEQTIYQRKMMLSYFDLPIVSNSYDLLHEAGTAMKALWPDHYEIQLKQIMAQWNNPEENTLLKEKELTLANIRKVEAQGDGRLIAPLKAKLVEIEEQLLMYGVKTRSIILILNKLRSGISMDDFMPVIKEDLSKTDQSQGLILLGLYCLDEIQRVERFISLYWLHISIPQSERVKLHLLVSLKATTDFLVKFDLSKLVSLHQDPEKAFTHERYIRRLLQLVLDSDADVRILAIEALCRLLYHNRISEEMVGSSFMRLLLLWWETSSEEVSAKAVHTISIFVKQFIERGPAEVRKLAEALCVFFRVLVLEQAERRAINKRRITYNLRFQEFVKRSVVIAMTVLKYHKQSRQVIWKYQQSGAELGPQELFVLFLFRHENLHYCLEKALNICDFYEEAPLETVILLKKETQLMLENTNFGNRKNLQASLKKLEKDLQERIQIKNQETFNQQLLNGLRKQLREYELLINQTAAKLAEELQVAQIFTTSTDLFGGVKFQSGRKQQSERREESEQEEVDMDQIIADIEDAIPISSQSEQPSKKPPKTKNNLSRISQGNESEQDLHRKSDEKKRKQELAEKEMEKKRGSRKKQPQPMEEQNNSHSNSLPEAAVAAIPLRTRSRHRV